MNNVENLLKFTETLVQSQKNGYCNDLQRVLLTTILQGERKTYEQIADEQGYSPKYIKQDVAPKLWHLLSEAVGKKVTKSNARAILEREMQKYQNFPASQIEKPVSHTSSPLSVNSQVAISWQLSTSQSLRSSQNSILLVDDETKNLKLLSELFEDQGYEVRQAIKEKVVLQAVSCSCPDLILLDLQMPELDGYDLCQKLKANPETENIPVIFIITSDNPWDKVKAFSFGVVDCINKPFKSLEVLARVEHQLKIQQIQKKLKAQNAQLQQEIQEYQRIIAIDNLMSTSIPQQLLCVDR